MAIDTIGTNAITNDAVTAAKIPAGAVNADITAIPDGSVTAAKIAADAVTNSKILAGTMSPQKLEYREYFRFSITSHKTGLSDNVEYVMPFDTNGNVDFDSTGGFSGDAANTWTPAVSTFGETQYWLFGISAGFDTNNAEAIRDAVIGVQQSTDGGSNWTDVFHNAQRFYDQGGTTADQEGATLTATYLHSFTPTANYRYRMMMYVNTNQSASTTWDLNYTGAGLIGGGNSFDDNSLSYWWGLRVY
tara:strand:- start:1581 stop:2318 length:738 start_codon:yes stop_codon:yes gene_type:complete